MKISEALNNCEVKSHPTQWALIKLPNDISTLSHITPRHFLSSSYGKQLRGLKGLVIGTSVTQGLGSFVHMAA